MKNIFRRRQSSPTLESLTKQMDLIVEDDHKGASGSGSGSSSTNNHKAASGVVGMPSTGSSERHTPSSNDTLTSVQGLYGFHSTCLQIKDPVRSIKFYEDALGMELVKESESDDYTMYFLGFKLASTDETDFGNRVGLLQLVHVHGSDTDDAFRIKTGHPGFSHFSVSVPDVDKARMRMERMGVEVIEDGSNARGFAAVADPDGYHIQLIAQSVGEDDRLRAELERLMKEPAMSFNPILPPDNGDVKQQVTDALRFAKGGSPVSPRSPRSPC